MRLLYSVFLGVEIFPAGGGRRLVSGGKQKVTCLIEKKPERFSRAPLHQYKESEIAKDGDGAAERQREMFRQWSGLRAMQRAQIAVLCGLQLCGGGLSGDGAACESPCSRSASTLLVRSRKLVVLWS